MIVRPAAEDDWRSVGALAELLVQTHYSFDRERFVHPDTLRADAYVARLRDEIVGGLAMVYVAEIDGGVAGYVFAGIEPENWKELRREAGYIHDLVVSDAHRRRGVARALVASALDWFDARGVARVMLWTAPSNSGAQALFRSVGFRPTMIEMTLDATRRSR